MTTGPADLNTTSCLGMILSVSFFLMERKKAKIQRHVTLQCGFKRFHAICYIPIS